MNTTGSPGVGQVLGYGMGGLAWENPATAFPFWSLIGNSGTVPGMNYVGTTDNQPLEFHVNSLRALRLEPTATVPNLIGGYSGNLVDNSAQGVTIGGGGTAGFVNHVSSTLGTIAGGSGNIIGTNANDSTICGGRQNGIDNAWRAFIGGGLANSIQSNATYATIAGGYGGSVQTNSYNSVIGGGEGNTIQANSDHATIGGGQNNLIQTDAKESFIGGGANNSIQASDYGSTISGGNNNNILYSPACESAIGGGTNNIINSAKYGTIGGGNGNGVGAAGLESSSEGGTVPGGENNYAGGFCSFAAGQRANAVNDGCFVWADSTPANFSSTAANQFIIRAQGGVGINTNNPNGAALAVNGKITSPMWKATQVINQAGPLTGTGFSQTFTSGGGTLLIFVAGSGFSVLGNASVGMNVLVDGTFIDNCLFFANASNTHVCFVPKTLVKTSVAAGTHTLQIQARLGTSSDVNDNYTVTITELPF